MNSLPIPPELIAETLTDFCICFFKHTAYDPDAPPHYYLSVPLNDDSAILLCIITSQIEKKESRYRKSPAAIDCLVKVSPKDMAFLKRESIIECNQPELIHKKHFGKSINPKVQIKIITRDIPVAIREQVLNAIEKSPIVKPYIKSLLKNKPPVSGGH